MPALARWPAGALAAFILLAAGAAGAAALSRPNPPSPLRGAIVVIDPGHGGVDGGAVAPDRLTLEKHLALDLALRLRADLESAGAVPYMTRTADIDPSGLPWNRPGRAGASLRARLAVAVRTGAAVFVSLHLDTSGNRTETRRGPSAFHGPASAANPEGAALASALEARFHQAFGVTDRAYPLNAYVLRTSPVPATLVEAAFLNNPEDLARIRAPAYQAEVARAITAGIADFLRSRA